MAVELKPIGFLSYARSDDAAADGRISAWRRALEQHLRLHVGRASVQIFQDSSHIEPGADWRHHIGQTLETASFFIAVVTPAFLQSEMCAQEALLFRRREQALRRGDLIVPVHYIDTDAVDRSNPAKVVDLNVLRLLDDRQWADFRPLRLRDASREDVQTWLNTLAVSICSRLQTPPVDGIVMPPPVPNQGFGQHFVLDQTGVVRFAPAETLDPEGNNVALLRSLHPLLLKLARSLAEAFGRTNAHKHLGECLRGYRHAIDRSLDAVNFGGLWTRGVILSDARAADATDKEEPPLDSAVQGTIDSLLNLHRIFIMATKLGATALSLESAGGLGPHQKREEQQAALAFTGALQGRTEVIGAEEATALQAAAQQIAQGLDPVHGSAAAVGMLRNAAIVMAAGAMVASVPEAASADPGRAGTLIGALFALLGSEALTRSASFGAATQAIARLDYRSEVELREALAPIAQTFRAQLAFVRQAEPALRRLAGDRHAFGWLHRSLDWIKRPGRATPNVDPVEPPLNPPPPAPRSPTPELLLIPKGTFQMGIPEVERRREGTEQYDTRARGQHLVDLEQPFWLGKYPVTRGEYAAFVAASGHRKDGDRWRDPGFKQTDRDPIVNVSVDDAEEYIAWLNHEAGPGWRLPSEAEWEYAARGRTETARYWDSSFGEASRYAHAQGRTGTSSVDLRVHNAFGLHDMLGNVWEWVADPWHDGYDGAPLDGSAWMSGGDATERVLRGGSWHCDHRLVRAGVRIHYARGHRTVDAGFRVARNYLGSSVIRVGDRRSSEHGNHL